MLTIKILIAYFLLFNNLSILIFIDNKTIPIKFKISF